MPDEPVPHPPAERGPTGDEPTDRFAPAPNAGSLSGDVEPPVGRTFLPHLASRMDEPLPLEPLDLPHPTASANTESPISLEDDHTPVHPAPMLNPLGTVNGRTELLSLVIPLMNERESLRALYAEIAEVARTLSRTIEIIFVDDGSTDDSWTIIQQLAARDVRIRGIRFRRNFGKAAALAAGFSAAHGTTFITMDADLQDDPHEIPAFLAMLDSGLDVISGWKKVRHDPWHKTMPSRVFNGMVSTITGVKLHDHNCGMKAYRAEVLREVHLYGEMHRFIPVLADGRGFRVGEMVIQHRARQHGHSKYGWQRFIKGFLDLLTVRFLTKFGRRPKHIIGAVGLFSWAFAGFGLLLIVLNALLRWIWPETGIGITGQAVVLAFSLAGLIFGGQMLATGLLAELIIARRFVEVEPYSVAERT